jgi:agmatinase
MRPGRADTAAVDEAREATRDALRAARLVLSDDLAIEAQDDTHVTVFHRSSAARLKMSRAAYRFLLAFDAPRTVGEVVCGQASAHLFAQVRLLVERGMLLDADAPPAAVEIARLRTAVAYRFCNAPTLAPAAPGADFVVVGVPYDLGGDIDSRSAPALIRQKSLDHAYEVRLSTGRPRGWFDANRARRILEGATIADAGDVHVEYGEDQRDLFARIGRALEDVCPPGSVPVLLGGDRSITWATVDHMRRRGPLTVVQLARRPAVDAGAGDAFVAADAVARLLSPLEGVDAVFAIGGLEGDDHGAECAGGATLWSAAYLRQAGAGTLAERLGDDRAIHLSVDMSATTRDYVRPRAAGEAGLALAEIVEVIRTLGAAHRVVSIDIVGLDTQHPEAAVSSAVACQLALCAMSAACDGARGGA